MAGAIHQRSIIWVAALVTLLASLPVGMGRARASATSCPQVVSSNGRSPAAITAGTTPILFVHGINESPGVWIGGPGNGNVGGTNEPPLTYIQTALGSKVMGYAFDWSADAGPGHPVAWITDPPSPNLGTRLEQAIGCVARAAGHKVIIVTHSMGGLITEYASDHVPNDIAAVFSLGAPYRGSWLASTFAGQDSNAARNLLAQALDAYCSLNQSGTGQPAVTTRHQKKPGALEDMCSWVNERSDSGVEAMRAMPPGGGGWTKLHWPGSFPVYPLAGSIQGILQPLWPLNLKSSLTGEGDLVVSTKSQLAGASGGGFPFSLPCPVREPFGTGVIAFFIDAAKFPSCFHPYEPDSKALLDQIIRTIQIRGMIPTPASQSAPEVNQIPDFFVHNGYELGSLYRYPRFPTTIGLDNHDFISALHWAHATPADITATGTLNVDNCTPACASGTYVTYPVELVVSAPQHCTVKVHKPYSDQFTTKQAYVYNTIFVKVLRGNPPSYLVGNTQSLPPACQANPASGASPTSPSQPTSTGSGQPGPSPTGNGSQPTAAIAITSIFATDSSGNKQANFNCGDNGQLAAQLDNPSSAPIPATATLQIWAPNSTVDGYDATQSIAVPAGNSTFYHRLTFAWWLKGPWFYTFTIESGAGTTSAQTKLNFTCAAYGG